MDAGRTRETATPLALDTPHTETLEPDGDIDDIDYYRIEIVESAQLQLRVWTTGDLDTEGELEDSSGTSASKKSPHGEVTSPKVSGSRIRSNRGKST